MRYCDLNSNSFLSLSLFLFLFLFSILYVLCLTEMEQMSTQFYLVQKCVTITDSNDSQNIKKASQQPNTLAEFKYQRQLNTIADTP